MSTLTISLIQCHLHWEDVSKNLSMFEEMIGNIPRTEVIILPEMFSTGYSMKPEQLAEKMDGNTVSWMKKIATEKKVVLTGSVIIEENGHYYNRLIWMLPNGQLGYYDKRHLFTFAGEHEHYTAGARRLIAQVKGWKLNLQVCYDLRFPVWARQQNTPPVEDIDHAQITASAQPEYDILIYVANWPERRNHAWKTLLQARAIENQCYVVGVNRIGDDGNGYHYSGDSMFVDAMGKVLFTKANEEVIHTMTLEKEPLEKLREDLPFLKDRDLFSLGK